MLLLKIICSNVFVLIQHCFGEDLAINVKDKSLFSNKRLYYEYEPARLDWHAVHKLCRQRSGALAVVSSAGENPNLTSFLQSINISEPVWITTRAPEICGNPDLILNFRKQNASQSARLLHKFSNMTAVTVCAHLQFSQTCSGSSTLFSYFGHSFISEFQLRATVMPNKPIQLALLVHGQHGPYISAFNNDGFWHSTCVSWTGDHGNWTILVDGKELKHGTSLYSSDHIRGNGIFIIGQDTFYSSINSKEAFCGNITQLHIWDQVLDSSKIQAMEKECSLNPTGLIFRWSKSELELTPNLQISWGYSQCQALSQMPNNDSCMTYDPSIGQCNVDNCETLRAGVCQFNKDPLDDLGLSPFPKTPFFQQISEDLPALEEYNSSSVTDDGMIWLSLFAQSVVWAIENNPDLITPPDLLYLTQTIKLVSQVNTANISVEVIRTMASNYLNLASALIDPFMVSQWLDLKLLRFQLRPLMVIESIEKILWVLADAFFTEKQTFTLSTRNLDIHIVPRTLSHVSCSCAYKPQASHSNSQDEILIPETELQRLSSLGHLELMFIHAYYGQLLDLLSKIELEHQTFGGLSTAVISATVRDVSRAKNIPVSVQYTLSTAKVAEYSNLIAPTCVFWNVNMMNNNLTDWSDKGCSVIHSIPNATSCFCNHTTNFAVLMNYMNNKWSAAEENILTKLTFIGSGASLCALLVTLMLFTVLNIPKSDRTSVHRNLCISLTFAQIVLLCSGAAVNNKVACTLVTALLHLFFMAAFSWMLVEGLLLWSKVVAVNLSEDRHMKYYYLIGWGMPVLIVTITLASASGKYTADGYCWLNVQNGVIWGFVGPVVFIFMVNVMVLTRVLIITISTAKRMSLMKAGSSDPVEGVFEQIMAAVKAVMVLLPILGLNWLCGLLVPYSIIMAYIFIILNSLQGLFIFLIYGVYNTEVRNTVKRIKEKRKAQNFSNDGSSRPSSSSTNFQLGSTPVPNTLGRHDFAANQAGSLSISSACTSLS